jgi:hypothetical protein
MRWRKANTSDRGRDHSWTAAATLPATARSRPSSSSAFSLEMICLVAGDSTDTLAKRSSGARASSTSPCHSAATLPPLLLPPPLPTAIPTAGLRTNAEARRS